MENLNNFQLLEYAAWGISAVLGLWMLFDMIRTNAKYSEETLISSREGEIEDVLVSIRRTRGGTGDPTQQSTARKSRCCACSALATSGRSASASCSSASTWAGTSPSAKAARSPPLSPAGSAGLLYTCVAMIDSEVTSTVAAAGGQYAQAKHIVGPLMAFNVGLFLVLAYTMLEAGNAITAGYLVQAVGGMAASKACTTSRLSCSPSSSWRGSTIAACSRRSLQPRHHGHRLLRDRRAVRRRSPVDRRRPEARRVDHTGLPYGWLGVIAALHFGLWFYLGIEGTTQAAEEVRSPARALPLGTMTGMITLLDAATMTWYICVGLMPWEYLGQAITPLFDAARLTGSLWLMVFLFVGTIFSTLASANGCINDASRAWFSMGRDRYLPVWFGAVHPVYRTPFRSIVFLRSRRAHLRSRRAARSGHHLLDPVGPSRLHLHVLQHGDVPQEVAAWHDPPGLRASVPPAAGDRAAAALLVTYFAVFLGYGTQLVAMMVFYIIVSAWFAFHRYKYVRRGDQFTMAWPRPVGY